MRDHDALRALVDPEVNCRKATSCDAGAAGKPGVLLSISHTTHFRDEGQAASPPCTSFDKAAVFFAKSYSDEVSANAAPQDSAIWQKAFNSLVFLLRGSGGRPALVSLQPATPLETQLYKPGPARRPAGSGRPLSRLPCVAACALFVRRPSRRHHKLMISVAFTVWFLSSSHEKRGASGFVVAHAARSSLTVSASSAGALAGDLCGGEGNNVGRVLAAFFMPQECAERLALRPGDVAAVLPVFDRNDRGDSRLTAAGCRINFSTSVMWTLASTLRGVGWREAITHVRVRVYIKY